jgi:hypothetical protein
MNLAHRSDSLKNVLSIVIMFRDLPTEVRMEQTLNNLRAYIYTHTHTHTMYEVAMNEVARFFTSYFVFLFCGTV